MAKKSATEKETKIELPDDPTVISGDLYLGIDGIREHNEYSLVRVIGEAGMEIADAIRGLAHAIRGLPDWSKPPS
jgi:uncharacterized protein (UPF0218 family)